jgi:hypothetical protein
MARAGSADLPDGESGIFLREVLDRKSLICPSGGSAPQALNPSYALVGDEQPGSFVAISPVVERPCADDQDLNDNVWSDGEILARKSTRELFLHISVIVNAYGWVTNPLTRS